jgi:hypothetical protein
MKRGCLTLFLYPPDPIADLSILHQYRPILSPQLHRHQHITSRTSNITDRCEQHIGGQNGREEREPQASQRDNNQRSQPNDEILIAPEELLFRAAIKRQRQLRAKVGPATPEEKGQRVDQFVQRQNEDIADDIADKPEHNAPEGEGKRECVLLPVIRGQIQHHKDDATTDQQHQAQQRQWTQLRRFQ